MLDTERILQALNDLQESFCSIKIEKDEIITKFDNIENNMHEIDNNLNEISEDLLELKELLSEHMAQINNRF